jgi:hypothetical protein
MPEATVHHVTQVVPLKTFTSVLRATRTYDESHQAHYAKAAVRRAERALSQYEALALDGAWAPPLAWPEASAWAPPLAWLKVSA